MSEPIIRDPRLRKLSFTGSTPVGERLLEQAARRRAAHVDGARRQRARSSCSTTPTSTRPSTARSLAKFRNIGQACTAANRFIVHRSVADEFARRVTERVHGFTIGRGTEDGVTIGPLIDDRAVAKATQLVGTPSTAARSCSPAARAIDRPGTFYEATVLTDVQAGSDILREEIFGPVLAIVPFDDRGRRRRASRTTPSTASSRTSSPRASRAGSA